MACSKGGSERDLGPEPGQSLSKLCVQCSLAHGLLKCFVTPPCNCRGSEQVTPSCASVVVDYFELKATNNLWVQEKLLPSHVPHQCFNCLGNLFLNILFLFFLISKSLNRKLQRPWLVWPSGLSTSQRTKKSLLWFLVKAHVWVAGRIPSWRSARGNHTLMFLSLSSPLSSPLSKHI